MSSSLALEKCGRVVVIGGGITGLSAAFDLVRAGADVVLLEKAERLGGNIRTERHDGFLIDAGPDSFVRTKPSATELCKELDLENQLVEPSARKVYVAHRGRLEPLPDGLVLGAPTRVLPLATTRLLSLRGKLRALLEAALPPAAPSDDESIDSFLSRRLGHEISERIAGPLLAGIYAGDVTELSIRATFPQLSALERSGGVIRGLRRQMKSARKNSSPFYSLSSGMGTLVDRLKQRIGAAARVGAPARRIEMSTTAARFNVLLESGESLDASSVVLACPAHVASNLVTDERLAIELRAIPYRSTATVFAAFERGALPRPLDGVGFVAPSSEAKILAGTWVSSKWDGRAPNGSVLVRAFVGGARGTTLDGSSDSDLVELALGELGRLMGPLGTPLFTRVYRYANANPQPIVGHSARLERIAALLGELPGLYVAGAAYDGVGIPDCIRQGREAAKKALERVTA